MMFVAALPAGATQMREDMTPAVAALADAFRRHLDELEKSYEVENEQIDSDGSE